MDFMDLNIQPDRTQYTSTFDFCIVLIPTYLQIRILIKNTLLQFNMRAAIIRFVDSY